MKRNNDILFLENASETKKKTLQKVAGTWRSQNYRPNSEGENFQNPKLLPRIHGCQEEADTITDFLYQLFLDHKLHVQCNPAEKSEAFSWKNCVWQGDVGFFWGARYLVFVFFWNMAVIWVKSQEICGCQVFCLDCPWENGIDDSMIRLKWKMGT